MRWDTCPSRLLCRRIFRRLCGKLCCLAHFHSAGADPFSESAEAACRGKHAAYGYLGFEKECYRNLSGGQQQRVLLARGALRLLEALVLDEPVTGLGPQSDGGVLPTDQNAESGGADDHYGVA